MLVPNDVVAFWRPTGDGHKSPCLQNLNPFSILPKFVSSAGEKRDFKRVLVWVAFDLYERFGNEEADDGAQFSGKCIPNLFRWFQTYWLFSKIMSQWTSNFRDLRSSKIIPRTSIWQHSCGENLFLSKNPWGKLWNYKNSFQFHWNKNV